MPKSRGLDEALEAILEDISNSLTIADRESCLDRLRRAIRSNATGYVDKLDKRAWQRIFETIFQTVVVDKADYYKDNKTQKGRAENHLAQSAKTIRALVEVAVSKIKIGTVSYVLQHVVTVLPGKNGLVEPLARDYIKAMRCALQYRPHVEHLRDSWSTVLLFCVNSLDHLQTVQEQSLYNAHGTFGSIAASDSGTPAAQVVLSSEARHEADELVTCIMLLHEASNACVQPLAPRVIDCLVTYLELVTSYGRAHLDALSGVNCILEKTGQVDLVLTYNVVRRLMTSLPSLWAFKSNQLRDEVLRFLIISRLHLYKLFQDPLLEESFRNSVSDLLSTLKEDYTQRSSRYRLHLEDIDLRSPPEAPHQHVLISCGFMPRVADDRIDADLACIYFIAFLSMIMDKQRAINERHRRVDHDQEHKRARIPTHLDELMRSHYSSDIGNQICAMQFIVTRLMLGTVSAEELETIVIFAMQHTSGSDATIASWAYILLAFCAQQSSANTEQLKEVWKQAWQLCCGAVTHSSTSRAACFLLSRLNESKLIELKVTDASRDAMLQTPEISGPTALTDSSIGLWIGMAERKVAENPGLSGDLASQLLKWLLRKWTPSSLDSRAFVSGDSFSIDAGDIIRFLQFCTGYSFLPTKFMLIDTPRGVVSQAWLRHNSNVKLLCYLMQLGPLKTSGIQDPPPSDRGMTPLRTLPNSVDDRSILEHCHAEACKTLENLHSLTQSRSAGVTHKIVQLITDQCLVFGHVAAQCLDPGNGQDSHLVDVVQRLSLELLRFLSRADVDQTKLDTCLLRLAHLLPSPLHVTKVMTTREQFAQFDLFIKCSHALEQDQSLRLTIMNANTPLSMELDDAFDSQMSDSQAQPANESLPRDNLAARSSSMAFRKAMRCGLRLIASTVEQAVVGVERNTSTTFLSQIPSLSPHDLCFGWSAVKCLLQEEAGIDFHDLTLLFEHVTQSLLEDYYFNMHEATLLLCLDLLGMTASYWLSTEHDELGLMARETANWFLTTALNGKVVSDDTECCVVDLCFRLMDARGPEFKLLDSSSSEIRDSIVQFLERDLPVMFHTSHQISTLFKYYSLSEHESVLDSVWHCLLIDTKQHERMALRLNVFAELASKWQTLLRRCVYHIFETAGGYPFMIGFAKTSIRRVAEALNVHQEKEIFVLFASQLLYSWLAEQSVSSIPYTIFGFSSLSELLHAVEEELAAQVFMRGNSATIHETAKMLEQSDKQFATSNFGRIMAYCFAQDSESKRRGQKSNGLEATVLQIVGDKNFVRLFQKCYPQILSTVFLLQSGDTEEKLLRQFQVYDKTDLKYAHDALTEMRSCSESPLLLPPDQQPAFHTKGLLDSIYRITRRSGRSFEHLWSPPVYVFVLRAMLRRLNPRLGSLHACSIVRKIRVLLAMTGKSALSGYPLEMTLHALRPFLTDQQCANDAAGIVQYVLHNAKPALTRTISFVAGYITAILLSLRNFSLLPRDIILQQRDPPADLQKAAKFQQWIVQSWYPDFEVLVSKDKANSTHLGAFRSLLQAAIGVQLQGNAKTSKGELDLLQVLIQQNKPNHRLLNTNSQFSILRLISDNFLSPKSFRDDIFGSDSLSLVHASQIWQSCVELQGCKEEFLVWAGNILGRARLAGNWHRTTWTLKDHITALDAAFNDEADIIDFSKTSRALIMREVVRLLSSDELEHVGLAEDAVRSVLAGTEDLSVPDNSMAEIPLEVANALQLSTIISAANPDRLAKNNLDQFLLAINHGTQDWLLHLALAVIEASEGTFLKSFASILRGIEGLAETLLAPILHVALWEEMGKDSTNLKSLLSKKFSEMLRSMHVLPFKQVEALLRVTVYLRQRPHPNTFPIDAWEAWLDLDTLALSKAAVFCGMHTSALMFFETRTSITRNDSAPQKRTSANQYLRDGSTNIPHELLLAIYRSIDEPDSFYGVHQSTSLSTVVERLDYENNGAQSLLFHSARLDSSMRRHRSPSDLDTSGILRGLSCLNLSSVSYAVMRGKTTSKPDGLLEESLTAARKLEQWDLGVPESAKSAPAILYKLFQAMSNATELSTFHATLNSSIASEMKHLLRPSQDPKAVQTSLCMLGIMTELVEVVTSTSFNDLKNVVERMRVRDLSLSHARSEEASLIHSSRGTLFNVLSQSRALQDLLHISQKDARSIQVRSLLSSCSFAQRDGLGYECLSSVTYLADLIPICRSVGLNIEAQAQEMIADILWAQGEQTASIHMLESLTSNDSDTKSNPETATRATILAKLGHHIGDARLETSAQITHRYLQPALQGLKGSYQGEKAGRVLHEFAAFCDRELHNPNLIEEFNRSTETRARRKKEVELHQGLARSAKTKTEKDKLTRDAKIAARWFKIDGEEHARITGAREALIQQCVENYVRSLAAWDQHDSDVLRLFSIWLEYSHHDSINQIIATRGDTVPSAKFAVLISQLTSLLQQDSTLFVENLSALILRICLEHPHHSLHHIFATLNNSQAKDGASNSRRLAAEKIVEGMRAVPKARDLWNRFWQADTMYHTLASYTDRSKISSGKEMALERISPSATLVAKIKNLRVPPATMNIVLRKDCDYSTVPITVGFKSRMTIASGISAPKILTAIASDGRAHKQLYKAGNDDLRQDAIMEQVFEQVSQLLKKHAPTRQRRLKIRTYKVLPLSGNSGIIEFVPNTMPLSDYLQPAHNKYYPSDWSWSRCREKLHSIAQQTTEAKSKLKVFQEIAANFNPVLRFFFLERFMDPDEWFDKRLAYTRSTAAISMLGHVLGLGDRHCHNILLDQKTGEAVHIDLGIAFEAGRILPVPEVVPFRLSRDIVNGFGITKTEGVFRRCCQFTLDALRDERESIMTLLNVLRFDPLVNWTVSPLRARQLQSEEQGPGGLFSSAQGAHKDDEGPAGRALGVVEKKLTQMMSTAATVSELIQQASDERNLAVLYSGWAPWA